MGLRVLVRGEILDERQLIDAGDGKIPTGFVHDFPDQEYAQAPFAAGFERADQSRLSNIVRFERRAVILNGDFQTLVVQVKQDSDFSAVLPPVGMVYNVGTRLIHCQVNRVALALVEGTFLDGVHHENGNSPKVVETCGEFSGEHGRIP